MVPCTPRVHRVSLSRHDRPEILAIRVSQICLWICTYTAENEGNSCAADWGRDLPPVQSQVDEFSQSALGAHTYQSAPLQQISDPVGRFRAEAKRKKL